jgi:hypothetical protein
MSLSLVILAAGMGSRYGGLKQLDPMGPAGETVLDYTVFDALRAGFDRVVFIIRHDFAAAFHQQVGARFADRLRVDYAYQELTDLPDGRVPPPGRVKPWGTGHALWCARAALAEGPFAVLNADDFYGTASLAALGDHLRAPVPAAGPPAYAMVGFPLGRTLSEHGTVSRGICQVDTEGRLRSIEEHTGISAAAVGPGLAYDPATPVSMNCWGFTPDFLPQLDAAWRAFHDLHGQEEKTEFYLPAAVNALVAAGAARVRVLPTTADWFGVTYREDKPRVQAALAALVAAGRYPSPLHSVRP